MYIYMIYVCGIPPSPHGSGDLTCPCTTNCEDPC